MVHGGIRNVTYGRYVPVGISVCCLTVLSVVLALLTTVGPVNFSADKLFGNARNGLSGIGSQDSMELSLDRRQWPTTMSHVYDFFKSYLATIATYHKYKCCTYHFAFPVKETRRAASGLKSGDFAMLCGRASTGTPRLISIVSNT